MSGSDLTAALDQLAVHLTESSAGLSQLAHDVAEVALALGQTPAPEPPDPGPGPSGKHPTDVIPEFARWTTMTPTGSQGDPDNDFYIGESIPDVYYVGSDGGVVFNCDVNGFHSSGSKYCRTENRMQSTKPGEWNPKNAWSSSGDHRLAAELSIDTSKLATRKRGNGVQIHDGGDDVCQIMKHETNGLGLMHSDGKKWESIDPNYKDGQRFAVEIQAVNNRIVVLYNGVKKVDIAKAGNGWYWKIGAYSQTGGASDYKEPAGARFKVTVYSCTITGGAF
jgi:hypothetical protein